METPATCWQCAWRGTPGRELSTWRWERRRTTIAAQSHSIASALYIACRVGNLLLLCRLLAVWRMESTFSCLRPSVCFFLLESGCAGPWLCTRVMYNVNLTHEACHRTELAFGRSCWGVSQASLHAAPKCGPLLTTGSFGRSILAPHEGVFEENEELQICFMVLGINGGGAGAQR